MYIFADKTKKLILGRQGENIVTAMLMQYQGLTVNDLGGGVYEVVKEQLPAGDYTHPIPYVDNMPVTAGLFYIFNDGNIWEAIKTGSGSAYDAEWFDIIAV